MTLKKLVAAGTQSGGDRLTGIRAARERFYRGDIAATIGTFSEKWGGLLRAADLAGYRAQFESPIAGAFADCKILASPRGHRRLSSCRRLGCLRSLI